MLHGYSVGMYYSMPVLIELLLQITSGSSSSIYTNSALGQGEVNYESVVPMALLHSLVVFGGLSLGAAKIRQVFRQLVVVVDVASVVQVGVSPMSSLSLLGIRWFCRQFGFKAVNLHTDHVASYSWELKKGKLLLYRNTLLSHAVSSRVCSVFCLAVTPCGMGGMRVGDYVCRQLARSVRCSREA